MEYTDSSSADGFYSLTQNLSKALGFDSGLDSAHVDPLYIQRLMEAYTSKPSEWRKYALSDLSRCYTRNLVDKGNGKSNLLILVWNPGKESAIHDHANSHCVMKILHGILRETVYQWPNKEHVAAGVSCPLEAMKITQYAENQVTYMSDQLGLHKISNPDPENVAISLHLYTPPNAADYGCHVFNERTGEQRLVQCPFFSEYSQKL